jgi:hypothetical protein
MKRLVGTFLVLGLSLAIGGSCCADREDRLVLSLGGAEETPGVDAAAGISVERKTLERIPVGTVIGKAAPRGWTNLVLLAIPTLTARDLRDAPRQATFYARMFKLTILANVAHKPGDERAPYYLEKVGVGFATTVDGRERIVNSRNTLGADVGMFGPRILKGNEDVMDNDVHQVCRTTTMLIFDAKSVMLRGNDHVNMIMRHAFLVDPTSGKLYTLVWLLRRDYQAAEANIQLLPEGMHEKRWLSIKRDKFGPLGIPTKEAFGLRQIPQGTAIPYTEALQQAATVKMFEEAQVPRIEATLRAAAIKASSP